MSRVEAEARGLLIKGSWQKGVVQQNEYHDLSLGASPRSVEKCADPYLGGAITNHSTASRRLGQLRRWREYFDSFGALVLLEEQAGKNQFAKLYIDYTPLGQVQRTWARITSKTMGYARYADDAFALQKSYSYEYDALGRVSRITNPDGTYSRFEFKGNVVIFEDELKHRFEAEMNKYGEVVAKRSWTGGPAWDPVFGGYVPLPIGDLLQSTYEYDAAGQLRKAVDPENGIYSYEYNLDGSLKRVKSPVSDWLFDYTASGKLSQVNKSSGARLEVKYDDRGRISVLKEHPGNGDDIGDYREHKYIYDASPDPALGSNEEYAGRLSEVKGIGYRVTFGYNGQGAVDRVALYAPAASPQPLMWVERLFLATGEVLQARFSSEKVVANEYDRLGRLSNIKAVDLKKRGKKRNQLSTIIQYNSGSQLAQVEGTLCTQGEHLAKRPGGEPFRFTRKHSYGPNGFVSTVDTQVANENPWLLQQWYGPNGQISRIRDDGLRDTDHTYNYDGSNRLVLVSGYDELADGTKNPSGNILLQYHKNSALASVTMPNRFIESYSYDNLKQLLISRTSSEGSYSYSYDEDGQRCTEKTPHEELLYRWSGAGNLAQVVNKATGNTMQFEYGTGAGRWLANRDGQKVYFLDMLEFDEAKNTCRLHIPIPGGIMCTLRDGDAPNTCTFLDEHGTAAIYGADGVLLEKSEFLPYGEKHILGGGAGFGFGFTGQRVEEGVGLTHFGARYYDARARQWISPDPSITEAVPGSTIFGLDVLQPYVYASADPVSKYDVGGLNTEWLTYGKVGLAWFGGIPVCSAVPEIGAESLAHSTNNPAANLAAAGLSAYSALHAAEMATANFKTIKKVEVSLFARGIMWISPYKGAIAVRIFSSLATVLNVGTAAYYGGRGMAGLWRLAGQTVDSMKASSHDMLMGKFVRWWDMGLRTAEDVDLAITYGGNPAWKATPFGLWEDQDVANIIEAENRAGMCLERPNIDFNRLYPPHSVNLMPRSEVAKAYEEYARNRQQQQKEAWGERPAYPGKSSKGGTSQIPDKATIIPIFGGGGSGSGSDWSGWVDIW